MVLRMKMRFGAPDRDTGNWATSARTKHLVPGTCVPTVYVASSLVFGTLRADKIACPNRKRRSTRCRPWEADEIGGFGDGATGRRGLLPSLDTTQRT